MTGVLPHPTGRPRPSRVAEHPRLSSARLTDDSASVRSARPRAWCTCFRRHRQSSSGTIPEAPDGVADGHSRPAGSPGCWAHRTAFARPPPAADEAAPTVSVLGRAARDPVFSGEPGHARLASQRSRPATSSACPVQGRPPKGAHPACSAGTPSPTGGRPPLRLVGGGLPGRFALRRPPRAPDGLHRFGERWPRTFQRASMAGATPLSPATRSARRRRAVPRARRSTD